MTFDQVIDAVYRNDIPTLERATREDINQTDSDGRTPLMHAILAERPAPAVVCVLLNGGADPNRADEAQRWTALHYAARDTNAELVRLLLDAGAYVDPVDVFGDTPLWRAAFETSHDIRAVQLLVERGADPRHKNQQGISPLDLAREMGRTDLVELLSGAARR
jgi:ankyrin repeat protein